MPPAPTLPRWLSDSLDGLAAGDIDTWMDVYADDAVHEFPFAADGAPRRLEGKDEIARYMARLPGSISFGSLSDVRVHEVGDDLVVEAEGHHRLVADGTPFDLRYVWVITRRDGQIALIRDYMGPRRASHS